MKRVLLVLAACLPLSSCATHQPVDCITACAPLHVKEFAPGESSLAYIGAVCRCADRELVRDRATLPSVGAARKGGAL